MLLVVGDILAGGNDAVAAALDPALVQHGRVLRQRVFHVGHAGQDFVLHIYERQRLFRHMRVGRRYGGYGVALVERLVFGKDVFGDGDALPRDLRHGIHWGEVGGGNDRLDFGMRLRFACVYGLDARVRVGAA